MLSEEIEPPGENDPDWCLTCVGDIHEVPVAALRPAESPRLNGVDARHVQTLAECEASLPPVLVHRDSMRVIDGMHRLCAAILNNRPTVAVRFFEGDLDEAFVVAVHENVRHGLPLTLADREAAAARILSTAPERSDSWIATVTGLAPRTVRRIRHQPGGEALRVTARIGKDGRVRPLNSAEARRAASEAIAKHPEASLRQIAKLTGISPATVRDVRERMRRGEDPVPDRQRSRAENPAGRTTGTGWISSEDAAASPGRDPSSLLRNLSRDPSLRHTEAGRRLLRWLFDRARGPRDGEDMLDQVPPHCGYLVAELARICADEWLRFAAQMERRLREMG